MKPNYSLIPRTVKNSLEEDVGAGDITAQLIASDQLAEATIISREKAILCGMEWAQEVYRQVDSRVTLQWHRRDGDTLAADQVIVTLKGPARALLTGERTALNWLQTLSGIATTTRAYVDRLKGTSTQLLDTRKTIPGLRDAEKYAVRIGGGHNHRMGLYDAFLIKENHIAAAGSITAAVKQACALSKKAEGPAPWLEVEVETLEQLQEALSARVERIMLDNFDLPRIYKAVQLTEGRAKLEVSGNVSLSTIRTVAETGVDYISVGALTKNVQAVDLSLRFIGF
ncbi:MAG TPA: carboxylating nicotinate-nucleotide diphosphorylase [Coxiellaceae bacterium]|nr:carboxylating nicotinate-nucleotide diphosphorylase [Coxiellaceae bacterium]